MKCSHPECGCVTASHSLNGELFCDSACAQGAADGDAGCGCQHASCEGAALLTAAAPKKPARKPDEKKDAGSRPHGGVTAPPEERRQQKDIGSESGREDSSRRPDVPPAETPARL